VALLCSSGVVVSLQGCIVPSLQQWRCRGGGEFACCRLFERVPKAVLAQAKAFTGTQAGGSGGSALWRRSSRWGTTIGQS
jgi:hypothetical protein